MQSILNDFKNNKGIHHAYLITGDISSSLRKINLIIEKIIGPTFVNSPDYYIKETEVFDIEDSRNLRMISQKKAISDGMRFFVVAADNFLEKAQNALLKTLEEPIEGNHFFIITGDEGRLLFTVRSRLKKIHNDHSNVDEELFSTCSKFLSSGITERLLMLSDIIKENNEPRIQKLETKKFLQFLQNFIFKKYRDGKFKFDKDILKELDGISMSTDYAGDSSSSSRMLLEYVSFMCPKFSEEDL